MMCISVVMCVLVSGEVICATAHDKCNTCVFKLTARRTTVEFGLADAVSSSSDARMMKSSFNSFHKKLFVYGWNLS